MSIDHRIFDAGVSADFESVHLSVWDTPRGKFVSDGCAFIKLDWCDDIVQHRVRGSVARQLPNEWFRRTAMTRYSNSESGTAEPVRVRPFYIRELTRVGADLRYRSAHAPAVVARDVSNGHLVGLVMGCLAATSPDIYESHAEDVHEWRTLLNHAAPNVHVHDLEALALMVAAEKAVRTTSQQFFDLEGMS